MDLLRIILAIFIPPLGVFLQEGIGKHFWINIYSLCSRMHHLCLK